MPVPSSDFDKNTFYATFATTSRLVACLTSESLVPVYFVPNTVVKTEDNLIGLCLLLHPVKTENEVPAKVTLDSILAVVPLRGIPILNNKYSANWNGIRCSRIDLVDNLDMLPHIYSISITNDISNKLSSQLTKQILRTVLSEQTEFNIVDGYDAVQLWDRFATIYGVNNKLKEQIGQELASSILFQKYTYDHPKSLPTLNSSTVAWEQSVVEGHATHPMHKARKSFPPMKPLTPGSYDLEHPKIRLVGVRRESATLRGDYEELSKDLVDALIEAANEDVQTVRNKYDSDYVYIAIHELQLPNVEQRFPDAYIFPEPYSIPVEALASLRSVARPDILIGRSVKLCLGIKISSALRTVTPFTTYFGPGFSSHVVPKLNYDPNVLAVEREMATISYRHEDPDVAKHCSSVIREAFEYDPKYKDDLFVPCGVLVEKIQKPDTNETLLTHVWELDSEQKRINFLERYIDLALRAFLPPCLENGVAFEAHGQNTLARFDRKTGQLKGFVIRDFGGIKVHNETLKKSTGCEIDVLPDSCVEAHTIDEVFKLLYHTLFHCQFQRLIRVLGLHYNGIGWEMVRKRMSELIPKDHIMWPMFMESEKVPGKCLVRMKIDELYRDYIYRPVPNMILFKPQKVEA
ncbi:IucC family-domain-containing protein [Cokeromyces recurvatus]|uniref:IucC family-domain-containing protein n=1 Tax=Cokeromyces recurvatus TaxID=90255 RepID=UPI00221F1D1B|nr:IucC family-domain-containing protein [Cokeromyces recurvatus]KAI7906507.1 IucC family-domain-containing protein [Cokeromyces recurvatus]